MTVTALHIIPSEKYFERMISILKNAAKNKNIIFFTTNKPYSHLTNAFKRYGIQSSKIFFIDCISKIVGERMEQEPENCIFVESPQSLPAIGIAIGESVKRLSGEKTLLFDSLSTLLLYNDANTIGKFSNFLVNKMRLSGIDTIILVLESDMNKDVIKQIESTADEVKKYGG